MKLFLTWETVRLTMFNGCTNNKKKALLNIRNLCKKNPVPSKINDIAWLQNVYLHRFVLVVPW